MSEPTAAETFKASLMATMRACYPELSDDEIRQRLYRAAQETMMMPPKNYDE